MVALLHPTIRRTAIDNPIILFPMKHLHRSVMWLVAMLLLSVRIAEAQDVHPTPEDTRSGSSPMKSLLLAESFDDVDFPPAGWQNMQLTGNGLWARSTAGSNPAVSPHSGEGMAFYNNYDFGAGVSAMLVTPALDLPAGSPKNVRFLMYRDNQWPTYEDSLAVYYHTKPSLNGAAFLGRVPRYYWKSGWYDFNFTIPASVSGTVYVMFKGNSNWGNDMFLDDIEIRALQVDDVGISSVVSPSAMIIEGDVIQPEVVVRNFGRQPQSDVPVRYRNGQTGEVFTQIVPFLDSAASVNVVLPPFTAATGGPADFLFYTDLPGDEDRSGDTLVRSVVGTGSNEAFVHAFAGGLYHSLYLCSDRTVKAWGSNDKGQLGDGTDTDRSVPVPVVDLTEVIRVSAGNFHSVALKADGTVWCFGSNGSGQLGHGGTVSSKVPVQVSGPGSFIAIAAGADHTLAIRSDSTVWAWGSNQWGQLGDGTNTDSDIPVQVKGISKAAAIAAGEGFSLAMLHDGTVMGWGANQSGQLGNGTLVSASQPLAVSDLTGVIGISTGTIHATALKNDGTVWAWGYNLLGQLGHGSNTDSRKPVRVAGLDRVTAVAAGGASTYAVRYDGTAWAWGWNSNGQLGDGTTTNSNLPVEVTDLEDIVAMAGGDFHGLALDRQGALFAMGFNDQGQLGNGGNLDSQVPVAVTGLCPGFTSVDEGLPGTAQELSISPNPSDGNFLVRIPDEYAGRADLAVEICNALGERVHFSESCSSSFPGIQLSGIAPGIHFIRIDVGGRTFRGKAIIR